MGSAPGSEQNQRWLALALVLATLFAYAPAVFQGGFVWDDEQHVVENETLRDLQGLGRIWLEPTSIPQYYPLVHTTFWVEYQLWGLEAAGYHALNVLLHAAAALLVFALLRRLSLSVTGAAFAAALFALHPVHVESVAWITERKNVLSAVFYLAAALAYLRFDAPEPGAPRSGAAYALASALFGCALLSKTVTATLPAALAVVLWWRRGRLGARDLWPLAPWLVVGIAAGLGTAALERFHVGAAGPEWDLGPVERVLVAGRAVWFYAAKLAWPFDLSFVYPRWTIDAGAPLAYAFPLSAAALLVALFAWRDRLGRGALAGLLFFGGTLFPALGFVNVYPHRFSWVANHFQYLASLGLIVPFAVGATALSRRLPPRAAAGAAGALLLLLGVLTWRETTHYRDRESLWRATLARNSTAWIAHNNMGSIQEERGDLAQAAEHFRAAIALKPDHANALYNLGHALERQGRTDESVEWYTAALAADPNHSRAHLNLGRIRSERGDSEAAIRHFRSILKTDPEDAAAHYNLGVQLVYSGRYDEALDAFRSAMRTEPEAALPTSGAAWVLARHPDASLRAPAEAVRLAERAVLLSLAEDPTILDTLAVAYESAGRVARAAEAARRAHDRARAIGAAALARDLRTRAERLYRRAERER